MTPMTFLKKLREELALRKGRLASLMAREWPKDARWQALDKEVGLSKVIPKPRGQMSIENMLSHTKIISALEDAIKKIEKK